MPVERGEEAYHGEILLPVAGMLDLEVVSAVKRELVKVGVEVGTFYLGDRKFEGCWIPTAVYPALHKNELPQLTNLTVRAVKEVKRFG